MPTQTPDINYGIVANTINASSVAAGPNAHATTHHTATQATEAIAALQLLLKTFIERESTDVQVAQQAKTAVEQAAASVNGGNIPAARSALQNIVATFKALGETASSAQTIVTAATGVIRML